MSWRKVRLGDICTIEKGATGILKAIPGQYPLVTTGEERKTHNEFQFDAEAVVIPLVSGTGHGHASIKRIHYQTGKFALGSILCAVIPHDKNILNAEYLYRFLDLNKDRELVARMRGMANVTLPLKEISSVEIPLPALKEQMEFVKKYKQLEEHNADLCTELNQQQDIIKQLRHAFLHEAMQGKLTKQEPSDGHARELLVQIKAENAKLGKKDKPLPQIKEDEVPFEIPGNWVWCRLGYLLDDLLGGFAFDSTRYSKAETTNQIIRLGNVKTNQLILETGPVFIDDQYASEVSKAQLREGDILITMTGTRAKRDYLFSHCLNDKDLVPKTLYLNQRVGCLRISSYISKLYINKALKLNKLLEPVFLSSTGAANQANIGVNALREILIPLPPLAEQQRIVLKLGELLKYCDDLEQSIGESQTQTDMLLQQVLREELSGKAPAKQDVRPSIQPPHRAVIDFKLTDEELRDLLGGYILTKADLQKDFGHLKLIKHMVTVEYGAETHMPTHYIQFQNGPYDKKFMEGIGYRLKKKEWFEEKKVGNGYTYEPLSKANEIEELFNHFFADKKELIDFLIGLMNKARPSQAEIIATVYAVWNDLLINQMDTSVDKIKLYFFNWSDHKKKAFKPEQVEACYKWMNDVGLVPKGTGRIIMRWI